MLKVDSIACWCYLLLGRALPNMGERIAMECHRKTHLFPAQVDDISIYVPLSHHETPVKLPWNHHFLRRELRFFQGFAGAHLGHLYCFFSSTTAWGVSREFSAVPAGLGQWSLPWCLMLQHRKHKHITEYILLRYLLYYIILYYTKKYYIILYYIKLYYVINVFYFQYIYNMDISCHKSLKDSTTTCPILGCSTVHFIPGSSFFWKAGYGNCY